MLNQSTSSFAPLVRRKSAISSIRLIGWSIIESRQETGTRLSGSVWHSIHRQGVSSPPSFKNQLFENVGKASPPDKPYPVLLHVPETDATGAVSG